MAASESMMAIGESGADDDGLRIDRSAKTLRELVLEKMRDAILDFHFRPGERLVERTLCDRLGVSRTVVREVLRHLEAEGLVETIPQQGPAVARPDPSKAAQIYEIRGLLEAEAARACALSADRAAVARLRAAVQRIAQGFAAKNPREVLRATTGFYETLFLAAGKTVAWDIVQSLNARINHLRAVTISTPDRDRASLAEMKRIVDAIAKRDATASHDAARDHVRIVAALAQRALTPSDRG